MERLAPLAAGGRANRCEGAGPRPRGRPRLRGARPSGAPGPSFGEIVFNTAMSGYQEVLTDPSYARTDRRDDRRARRQLRRARGEEAESDRVHVAGFVARDFPERWSGAGGEESLGGLPREAGTVGLHGLDTRALVRRHPRRRARCAPASRRRSTTSGGPAPRAVLESPPMIGSDLALSGRRRRTPESPGRRGRERFRVAAIDYGMKRNIVRSSPRAAPRDASSRRRRRAERPGRRPRRDLPLQRPGRPGGARRRAIRTIERARPTGQADLRHLPRAPAPRPRARRRGPSS